MNKSVFLPLFVAFFLILLAFNRLSTKREIANIIHGHIEWIKNTKKLRSDIYKKTRWINSTRWINRTRWIERTEISNTYHQCDWSPNDNKKCLVLVQNVVNNMQTRRILFLGDSTMIRLFKSIPHQEKNIIKTGRCDWLTKFGMKKSTIWIPPHKDAGPVLYGLKNNWCTDCSGCISHYYTGKGIANSYIAVEFAKDVEMQSELGKTTQESLVNFLKTQNKYELCVVNSGIHDQAIKGMSVQNYVSNVKSYLRLLSFVCPQIVWVETTYPKTDKYLQKKGKTQEWNVAVNKMIRLEFTEAYIIKVGEASKDWPHVDNVHLNATWYSELSRLFKFK